MSDADAGAGPTAQAGPADSLEIFFAPSGVFDRRRDGKFGTPLLILVLAGVVLYFATSNLIQPVIEAEISLNMANAKGLTPEQMEAGKKIGGTIAMIGQVAGNLIGPFIIGLVLWVVARIVGVKQTVSVMVMIATFALYPKLLSNVVGAIEMMVLPESSITSAASLSIGPARFVGLDQHPLALLLTRFDLFVLWETFLLGLGVLVAGRATKAQAWTVAVVMWALGSVGVLWGFVKG